VSGASGRISAPKGFNFKSWRGGTKTKNQNLGCGAAKKLRQFNSRVTASLPISGGEDWGHEKGEAIFRFLESRRKRRTEKDPKLLRRRSTYPTHDQQNEICCLGEPNGISSALGVPGAGAMGRGGGGLRRRNGREKGGKSLS